MPNDPTRMRASTSRHGSVGTHPLNDGRNAQVVWLRDDPATHVVIVAKIDGRPEPIIVRNIARIHAGTVSEQILRSIEKEAPHG